MFDIGGNKYRLIAAVDYRLQSVAVEYDLAKELGGQPVVSEVLRGKRKLTREHIERLSKRFGVSPATFYPLGAGRRQR